MAIFSLLVFGASAVAAAPWLYPQKLLTECYDYLFAAPLKQLYLHGPCFFNFGFWQGRQESQICAEISGPHVSESFWLINSLECQELIERRVNSFIVNIKLILYMYTLLCLFHTLMSCFTSLLFYIIIGHRNQRERYIALPAPKKIRGELKRV